MLRFLALAATPAVMPSRALADGTSGTLGRGAVTANELAPGAVTLDRMVELSGGRVIGRAVDASSGPPVALDSTALRALVDAVSPEIPFPSKFAARLSRVPSAAGVLRTLGFSNAGDGGEALYRRTPNEPSHPGKFQSEDGEWWELVPTQRITPQMFGAVGDGIANDSAAFDAAIAFCRSQFIALHVPQGDYLLSALSPLFPPGPGPRPQLRIQGAGRDLTRLLYAGDLGAPLLDAAPDGAGRLAGLDLAGLSIDGRGFSGTTIRLSHLSKCSLSELTIRNVRDIGILAEEWWDSTIIDTLLHIVGDVDRQLPSMRLQNRDAASANTSCNNLGFYDLHIERHPYRAIEILHTSRKLTFTRLKCHHTPSDLPPAGTDHVVLDGRGAPAGGGYGITFQGCHLAVASGSGYVLANTGGTADSDFRGVSITGGSVQSPEHYAVKALRTAGLTASGLWLSQVGAAGFYVHSDCRNVFPDWRSIQHDVPTLMHYDGPAYSASPRAAAEIEGGQIAAVGDFMVLDTQNGAASDALTSILGGRYGQTLTLTTWDAAREVRVRNAGNIRTAQGQERVLSGPQDSLLLRYDDDAGLWREVAYAHL